MTNIHQKVQKNILKNHAHILRSHIHAGPKGEKLDQKITLANLAAKSEISAVTLRNYMNGGSLPSLKTFIALAQALPPTYAAGVMALAGFHSEILIKAAANQNGVPTNLQNVFSKELQKLAMFLDRKTLEPEAIPHLIKKLEEVQKLNGFFITALKDSASVKAV